MNDAAGKTAKQELMISKLVIIGELGEVVFSFV